MAQFDLPVDDLHRYRYPRDEPADLDGFWARTMGSSRSAGGTVEVTPAEHPLATLDVHDVVFPGFGGDPVRGWWLLPRAVDSPCPVVVEFLGYGGGRGLPHERLHWASCGFAQLVVDSRGQGGVWNVGDTPDPYGHGPSVPGMLTRGLQSPETLYYRRLFTDAARAVDAVSDLPGVAEGRVDAGRVAAVGHSQGGAMALAAAALNPAVSAVAARAPFLCGIGRSVVMTDEEPYRELGRYLSTHRLDAEAVLTVLDHVDLAFLARRITVPAWFSIGLADAICPPSGIFAAVNAMDPSPQVRIWPYNGHEAGGAHDDAHLAGWLGQLLRR